MTNNPLASRQSPPREPTTAGGTPLPLPWSPPPTREEMSKLIQRHASAAESPETWDAVQNALDRLYDAALAGVPHPTPRSSSDTTDRASRSDKT